MALHLHVGWTPAPAGRVPPMLSVSAPSRWRLAPPAELRASLRHRGDGTLVVAQASTSKPTSIITTTKGAARKADGTSGGRRATSSGRSSSSSSSSSGTQRQGKLAPAPGKNSGSFWSQFYINITGFPFPLGPALRRNTVRYEVERDTIWTFEQIQALTGFAVYTPVRMTVIKLASGGLWVHNPLAPTEECVRLLRGLGCPVEFIVLGTFAYEHKQFVGPFSREFPRAKVYVAPGQWSFPLNLPPQFFGIFPAGLLTDDIDAPWNQEIDQKLLFPPPFSSIGEYVRFPEVAFFHRRTRTLMVTDALIYVSDLAPDVIPVEALLLNARDGPLNRFASGGLSSQEVDAVARTQPIEDTLENRKLGWARMALLVLFFSPFNLLQPKASFEAFSNRLVVGPVVETLIYSKFPNTVREWVEAMCRDWDVQQVIPTHFSGPVKADRDDLRRAFAFAYGAPCSADAALPTDAGVSSPRPAAGLLAALGRLFGLPRAGGAPVRAASFLPEDLQLLNNINNILIRIGAVKRLVD